MDGSAPESALDGAWVLDFSQMETIHVGDRDQIRD